VGQALSIAYCLSPIANCRLSFRGQGRLGAPFDAPTARLGMMRAFDRRVTPSCPVRALDMPMLPVYFRLEIDDVQAGVTGFRPNVFATWIDLDVERPVRR